jgi:anti-sigma regulatory factor (Ser/Thr protein kinase)
MDHLRLAWQAGETLLNDVQFEEDPKGTRYNVLLAMQELLTNVFRHGYKDSETMLVELRFQATPVEVEFEIRDRARQYDPTSGESPHTEDDDDDDDEMPTDDGGYGLVIVKAVMDDLSYSYEDGWNAVRAVKYIRSGVAVGASKD